MKDLPAVNRAHYHHAQVTAGRSGDVNAMFRAMFGVIAAVFRHNKAPPRARSVREAAQAMFGRGNQRYATTSGRETTGEPHTNAIEATVGMEAAADGAASVEATVEPRAATQHVCSLSLIPTLT